MDIAIVGIVLIAVVIIVLILGCAYKLAGNGEQDFDEIYTPSPLIQEKADVKGKKSTKTKKSKIKPKVVSEELIVNRVEVEQLNANAVVGNLRQRSSAATNAKQEQEQQQERESPITSSSPTSPEPPVAGNKKGKNKSSNSNRKEKSLPVAEELEVRVDNNNKLDAPTKPNELPPSSQSSTSTPEDPPQDPEYQEMMKSGNNSNNAKARKGGKNKARVPTGDDLIEKPSKITTEQQQPSTSKAYKGHATTEPDLDILIDGLRGGIKLTEAQLSVVVESLLMRNQNRLNDSKQEAERKRYQRDISILNEKLDRLNNEHTAANINLSHLRNELKTEKDKSKNWEIISQQAMQKCKDDQALASKTINDLRIQCENLHAQLRNNNPQQLQQLKEQLDRLGKDKYAAEKNNGVLQAETHRLNADLTATQSQMRYLQNENGQVKNENAQLRKQQTPAPKTNNYHQSAPAPPKEDSSIWKQELAHAKAEHERDSFKLAQTLAEIKKRDEKEQSQLQEMDKVHEEIKSLLKDAETLRGENEVLRQNLKNAEQQVKTGQSDLVRLQQKMNEQTKIDQQKNVQEEVFVAKQSASLETASPASGTQNHDDIKKKYEGMVSDLHEMKTSNERLFNQLGQANKKKDELEKLIGSFQAAANDKLRISELENCLKSSEARVKDMEVKAAKASAAETKPAASVSKQPSGTAVDNGAGSSIEDLESLRCQVGTANTNLKNKQIELANMRSELEGDKRRVEDAERRCQLAERKMAHLQSKMDNGRIGNSGTTAATASSDEMDNQRARNSELREKNGLLVKAVRDAEQNVQKASKELTSKYEKALKETESQMMSIARTAFPSAAPPPKDASQFKNWLQKLEALSSTNSKSSSHTHTEIVRTVVQTPREQSPAAAAADSKEAEQLKKERNTLLSQVDQYRNALVQVENNVTTMLKLAESENAGWKAKEAAWNKEKASLVERKKESEVKATKSSVQKAETVCQATGSGTSNVINNNEQLNALKLENSTLKQTLQNVDKEIAGLESVAKREEVKWVNRIRELEREIYKTNSQNGSTESRSTTTSTITTTPEEAEALVQIREVRRQLADLQRRLETEEKERSTLTIEINRLERDLVTERANGRDLSAQAVKLRGMLKTGQDALKQEQALVQQLQIQLKSYQAGGGINHGSAGSWSNKGVNNNSNSNRTHSSKQQNENEDDIQSELVQLKSRLSEREEQLHQEMAINKQLSHKLLALGVATQPLH